MASTAAGAPELSVVTPSKGRHELLLRKAAALVAQTLPAERFEWLVWLNEDEESLARLRARIEAIRPPFRWQLLGGSERPVGEARNLAAARARGRILLLSDDDVLPEPPSLEAHLRFHERHPDAVGIGPLRLPEALRERGRREPFERPARVGRRAFWFNMTGANSSLPTKLFERVGGYDRTLRGYGGEDTELALRLRRLGVRFRHVEDAPALHHGRVLDDTAKAYSAGRAHLRLALASRDASVALALGVHPLSLILKRVVLGGPWSRLLEPGTVAYERAYLRGALEGIEEERNR